MSKKRSLKIKYTFIIVLSVILLTQIYVYFTQFLDNIIFPENTNEDLGEEEYTRLEDLRRKIYNSHLL